MYFFSAAYPKPSASPARRQRSAFMPWRIYIGQSNISFTQYWQNIQS